MNLSTSLCKLENEVPEEKLAHIIIIIEQAEIGRYFDTLSGRYTLAKLYKERKRQKRRQNAKVNQKRQICEGRSSSLGRRAERCMWTFGIR